MGLLSLAKLEKLKISAFSDSKRSIAKGSFEVMFNPQSYSRSHSNKFKRFKGLNTSGRVAEYSHTVSDKLSLTLVIDGTGVFQMGLLTLINNKDVPTQIDKFLTLCFRMDGGIHEPRYLNIKWGKLDFDCRLESVGIKYTLFDKGGVPLRAELSVSFVEGLDKEKQKKEEGKSSPDLTHIRVVKEGDSLPLMAKEIYGSASYYIKVAQVNQLDDFRNLKPGQELYFPPLKK